MAENAACFPDEKKDFDLEIVLDAFSKCHTDDELIILQEYIRAFHELCRFFKLVGRIFAFVAADLSDKITILENHQASETGDKYVTVQSMLMYEISNDLTRVKGHGRPVSGSRTLLRLHRALEFILQFMQRISISTDEEKTSHIASEVYHKTLANHHLWIVRKMAGLAMYTLPTRKYLIELMCKHDYEEVLELLKKVVAAGQPVYLKVQALYEENGLLKLP